MSGALLRSDSDAESEDDMDYTYEPSSEDNDREGEDLEEEEEDDEDDDEDSAYTEQIRSLLNARVTFPNMIFRLGTGDGGGFLEFNNHSLRHTRRQRLPKYEDPVPNPEGQKLMHSGNFGSDEIETGEAERRKTKPTLSKRLLQREIGRYSGQQARISNQLMAQSLLPTDKADFIIHYDRRAYSGQFSDDGNFFYSCSQDFKVRMYDTSNPYNWKYYKTANYYNGQWTITDATLAPDNRFLAYSSITSTVYLANTSPDTDEMHMLEFSADRGNNRHALNPHYGIWSIRFSGDGSEIVAGASDNCLYVYDIEARKPILKLAGHEDDVNAVCYGDKTSPHILFSGSDDTTVKIWDRRSMGDGRQVGVFAGHLEGVTYVDSKGDGRYVLSNGKEQTMKLWDIRKMMDTDEFEKLEQKDYRVGFDYRQEKYREPPRRHPYDQSLVTYRGHSVHRTLIRCHFSPPVSTGSRYVYTGSADGLVKIYNLDATLAGQINVFEATKDSRPFDEDLMSGGYYHGWREGRKWETCVRDVSWHPTAPVLAATSWNGYGSATGTVSLHSWKGGNLTKIDNIEGQNTTRRYNSKMEEDSELWDPRYAGEDSSSDED